MISAQEARDICGQEEVFSRVESAARSIDKDIRNTSMFESEKNLCDYHSLTQAECDEIKKLLKDSGFTVEVNVDPDGIGFDADGVTEWEFNIQW